MKIIYSIAGTYNSGGMERVLANKANYLVNKGYEVSIITTDQRGKQPFFSLDERIKCHDLDINYEENNGKSFLNKFIHYPFKQWKHRKRLTAYLKCEKADIVISMFCNDASFMWKIKDGSKKVLEIHFSRYKRLQYGRKGFWKIADQIRSDKDKKTVRKYDRFVVLTHEDKNDWGNLSNMIVIPNALSFNPCSTALLDNKKVIAVGRYDYQKGFDYLIDAWAIVNRYEPEWKLDMIGGGEWLNRLQHQIDDHGLIHCIRLKPSTRNIEEEYLQASILALSSRYEGLPMVLLEGQSYGLPIVAFECKCGPRDVITDREDGFLIPEKNIELLAGRILQLIENEDLRKRMGQAARKNSQRFLEPVIMEQWERLFHQLETNRGI